MKHLHLHQLLMKLLKLIENKCISITDRREAIRAAAAFAEAGDIVVVAGKGHETYQEINGVRQDFDDRKVLMEAFIPA